MCYETSLTPKRERIEKRMDADFIEPDIYQPYYHKSGFAHDNVFIITPENPKRIYPSLWGLVPTWSADDVEGFYKSGKWNTLNAKSETIFETRSYSSHIKSQRCLILADGFFEPHKEGKLSIPYYCYIPSEKEETGREIFAFAGIYSEIDNELYSCSILTTKANPFFAEIHNVKKRMPLVLDKSYERDWLSTNLDELSIKELIVQGFTNLEFQAHSVSRDLYKRGIDTNNPDILKPLDNNQTLFD